jgi:esterase/lipase
MKIVETIVKICLIVGLALGLVFFGWVAKAYQVKKAGGK